MGFEPRQQVLARRELELRQQRLEAQLASPSGKIMGREARELTRAEQQLRLDQSKLDTAILNALEEIVQNTGQPASPLTPERNANK